MATHLPYQWAFPLPSVPSLSLSPLRIPPLSTETDNCELLKESTSFNNGVEGEANKPDIAHAQSQVPQRMVLKTSYSPHKQVKKRDFMI